MAVSRYLASHGYLALHADPALVIPHSSAVTSSASLTLYFKRLPRGRRINFISFQIYNNGNVVLIITTVIVSGTDGVSEIPGGISRWPYLG